MFCRWRLLFELEFAGALYHLTSRGDWQDRISSRSEGRYKAIGQVLRRYKLLTPFSLLFATEWSRVVAIRSSPPERFIPL